MSTLRQALAGVLLCTTLLGSGIVAQAAPGQVCYFGQCSAATVAAEPQSKIVVEHGSWAVVKDGNSIMIVDRFESGAKLAILPSGGKFSLLLMDPAWELRQGDSFVINIDVDGTNYVGTARVVDGQAVAVEGLAHDFLQAVYKGQRASLRIGNRSWELTLAGAAQSIDDAAALEKAAG